MNTPRILTSRIAAAALLCLAPSLHAASRFWVGTSGGVFSNTSNWSATDGGAGGATVPVAADSAFFTLNNTYTASFSAGVTNTFLQVENGTVTFDLNSNTYTSTSSIGTVVGYGLGQTGRLTVRDGTLGVDTASDAVYLGFVDGSTGFLTITTGGQLGTAALRPAIRVASNGSVASTGTVTVNDNGRIDATSIDVAGALGATGTVIISGPNAVADFSSTMTVGNGGSGTMSVTSGGTLTSGSTVTLGNALAADGSATVSGVGSSWTITGAATIGNSGDGTLTISSGALVSSAGAATLGTSSTGFGTATVSGANSQWNLSGQQTIGSSGLGVLNISNGGQVASSSFANVGVNLGGEGRVTVSGAGSLWTLGNTMTLGNGGTGDLLVSAGGEVSTTNIYLGFSATGIGVATVTGTNSKLTASGAVTVGNFGGTGTLHVASGAEVSVGGNLSVIDPAGAPIGTVNLDGGSIFVAGAFTNNGAFNFNDGLLRLAGNFQPNATLLPLTINGTDSSDLPTVELLGSTGTTTNVTTITVGNSRGGQLLLRLGRVINAAASSVAIGALVGGEGTVSVESGAQFLGINNLSVGGALSTGGGTGTLNIAGGTVDAATLRIFNGGTVNFSSGTLGVDSTPLLNGQFNWTGGTLRFETNLNLSVSNVPKLLGQDATLNAGQTLASTSPVTLLTPVIVDGGALNPNQLINESTLDLRSGSVSVNSTTTNSAGGRIFVQRDLSLTGATSNESGARIELIGGTGRLLGAGTITNSGLVTGDGTITNPVTNSATGRIRVDAGKTLFFTGAFSPNAGELNLQGGTLDFSGAVTNTNTGFIAGRGAIYSGGVTNNGQMAFSGGTADLHGDVTNAAGGRITTSGGATTTFYDDVIHNGTEIRTSAGSASVFFGAVSGAGPFTGTGTVYFEGDLRPGNSPASVWYEGDLVFGGASSLTLEIGGLRSGDEHDHLDVAGTFYAAGLLTFTLLNDFVPETGDTFDVLDVGTFAGDFYTIEAPDLPGDQQWDFSGLKTTGAITVVPEPGSALLALLGAGLMGLRRRRTN